MARDTAAQADDLYELKTLVARTARIVAGIAPAAACYVMTTHRGAAADMRIPTRSRRGSVLAISTEHDAAARFAH